MGLYPKIVASNPPVLTRRYGSVEFFVDAAGSDASSRLGNRPEKPLATIKEAISRCENGEQNIINLIAPGHVTETNPIVIDKQFVTIRGWPSQNPGGQSPMTCVATVNAAYFTIAAQDVVIRDMTIHGGASHPTINVNPVAWSFRTGVHGVTFKAGTWGIATGALDGSGHVDDAPSHGYAFTNCNFLPGLSSGGIIIQSNGSWGLIADNFFEYLSYGVYADQDRGAGTQVLRNRFLIPSDDVVGRAILLGTNAIRWFVEGNRANDDVPTAITFNPYVDIPDRSVWTNNLIGGGGDTAPG